MGASAIALPRTWLVGAGLLFALAVVVRVHNAFAYDIDMGFDAPQNWEYVEILRETGRLPHPETSWSTGHPPFFYAAVAGMAALAGVDDKPTIVIGTRLANVALSLLVVVLLGLEIRRRDPARPRRALIAVGLALALPVQIMMTTMFSEELLTASLITLVLLGIGRAVDRSDEALGRVALLGLLAGLAWLTKLTGVLVIAVGGLAFLWKAVRGGAWRSLVVFAGTAGLAGGWFTLRSWWLYGYLYPHGLPAHQVMFEMPPGSRSLFDYLYVPFSVFWNPNPLAPDLLHSVWGTTYASIWFDAHAHFLPTTGVAAVASLLLLLGSIPTAAFLVGFVRRLREAAFGGGSPSTALLVGYAGVVLAGYVAFTWRNPWFVTVKGSFLLSLLLPYAWWTSDTLDRWFAKGKAVRALLGTLLCVLFLLVHFVFAYDVWFEKNEFPGLQWNEAQAP